LSLELFWHEAVGVGNAANIRRGADKSLAFSVFLFAAQPREFVLDGLKKLGQQSHKCVELRGGICRVNTFFQSHGLLISL
jgi:hypothetical protein